MNRTKKKKLKTKRKLNRFLTFFTNQAKGNKKKIQNVEESTNKRAFMTELNADNKKKKS